MKEKYLKADQDMSNVWFAAFEVRFPDNYYLMPNARETLRASLEEDRIIIFCELNGQRFSGTFVAYGSNIELAQIDVTEVTEMVCKTLGLGKEHVVECSIEPYASVEEQLANFIQEERLSTGAKVIQLFNRSD